MANSQSGDKPIFRSVCSRCGIAGSPDKPMTRAVFILIAAFAAGTLNAQAGEIYGAGMDRELISMFQKRAVHLYREGKYPEAVKAASAAIDFAETVYEPGDLELAELYTTLALAHQAKGDYFQALRCHRKALDIRRTKRG